MTTIRIVFELRTVGEDPRETLRGNRGYCNISFINFMHNLGERLPCRLFKKTEAFTWREGPEVGECNLSTVHSLFTERCYEKGVDSRNEG